MLNTVNNSLASGFVKNTLKESLQTHDISPVFRELSTNNLEKQ